MQSVLCVGCIFIAAPFTPLRMINSITRRVVEIKGVAEDAKVARSFLTESHSTFLSLKAKGYAVSSLVDS